MFKRATRQVQNCKVCMNIDCTNERTTAMSITFNISNHNENGVLELVSTTNEI